jgi:hypothetical protein
MNYQSRRGVESGCSRDRCIYLRSLASPVFRCDCSYVGITCSQVDLFYGSAAVVIKQVNFDSFLKDVCGQDFYGQ